MRLIGITKSNKDKLNLRGIVRKYCIISLCIWGLLAAILINIQFIIELGFWDLVGFIGFCIQGFTGFYFLVYRFESSPAVVYFRGGFILSLYNLIILESFYFFFDIKVTADSLTMLFFPYVILTFTLLYLLLRGVYLLIWRYEPTILTRRYNGPRGYKFLLNGIFTFILVIGTNTVVILLMLRRLDYLGL